MFIYVNVYIIFICRYTLLEAIPKSEEHMRIISSLQSRYSTQMVSGDTPPKAGRKLEILIAPQIRNNVLAKLRQSEIEVSIRRADIQK